jgi:hypothetical protein
MPPRSNARGEQTTNECEREIHRPDFEADEHSEYAPSGPIQSDGACASGYGSLARVVREADRPVLLIRAGARVALEDTAGPCDGYRRKLRAMTP